MNTVTMLPMYVAGFENAASLFHGADVIRPPLMSNVSDPAGPARTQGSTCRQHLGSGLAMMHLSDDKTSPQ